MEVGFVAGRVEARAAVPVRDALAADDAAGYPAFYRAQFAAVARMVYLIVYDREQAADITQDAFVQLYVHWAKVSRYDAPHAWVRRVAIRIAVRTARRERAGRMLARQSPGPPATVSSPVDIDLLRAVARLPVRPRAAVALFYYEDRPVTEVAAMLGCSAAAAKVALHRARQTLADWLAPEVRDER